MPALLGLSLSLCMGLAACQPADAPTADAPTVAAPADAASARRELLERLSDFDDRLLEKLLEDVSFEAEQRQGETVTVDAAYVERQLAEIARNTDLSKYVL